MYVLFVTNGYPTRRYPYNSIFVLDQANVLVSSGVKIVYASVDTRSFRRLRKWGVVRETVKNVDVWSINIPLGPIPNKASNRIAYWGLKRLYHCIESEYGKPDILHAHFSSYIAAKLKDDMAIPLIITEHFSGLNKDVIENELFNNTSYAYGKADEIVSVSPSLAGKIKWNFNKESTYIPNLVDLAIFTYKHKERSDTFSFVSTGRLINLKRMDLLIEAFSKAFRNFSDVTLTIIGDGNEKQRLRKIINSHKLNDKVKLMGLCSRDYIADIYAKSDCFVLASQSETFGVSYIEALAMGLPVIASRCGGPEVFVNESNGKLVDVDSMEQLIKAMIYMYNNTDKYDSFEIAQEIVNMFSPDAVASQIISVYKRVLSKDQST